MIYLIGDTHGHIELNKLSNKNFPEGKNLTKNDYVIILGDFGLLWKNDSTFKYWLDFLNNKNYTILFIDGNHENFNMLNEYPIEEWNGGKIHKISPNIYHLMRGQVFTINNKKFFTFGGASSIDKLQRTENIDWWRDELPTYNEMNEGFDNLEKNNFEVDYILTHTCSSHTINDLYKNSSNFLKNTSLSPITKQNLEKFSNSQIKEFDIANKYFDEIKSITKFKHWYFGHFHMDLIINHSETIIYKQFTKIE